jgi:regulator of extracellular matrix RemA (YlzA/DUF370 family)
MGSSKAPVVKEIDPADTVVAAVAKDPETAQATEAHQQARQRKRGISATYTRYGTNMKSKLGE